MFIRLLAVLALLVAFTAAAEVAVPELRTRVTDLTGTLGSGERESLERKLADFERERGSQVAVLLVPTTQPETVEQYSIRVAEAWKIGRKEQDDGVLLLVAKDDRKLRIEVGYGLEGAIPDAIAKRVTEEVMLPRFRDGDFTGGINAGVDSILGLVRGENLPAPAPARRSAQGTSGDLFGAVAFGLLMTTMFLRSILGRFFGGLAAGAISYFAVMLLIGVLAYAVGAGVLAFLLALFMNAGRGGGWSNGPGGWGGWSSHGSGGSWGGGGFGGGGGGFGGGGASGSW